MNRALHSPFSIFRVALTICFGMFFLGCAAEDREQPKLDAPKPSSPGEKVVTQAALRLACYKYLLHDAHPQVTYMFVAEEDVQLQWVDCPVTFSSIALSVEREGIYVNEKDGKRGVRVSLEQLPEAPPQHVRMHVKELYANRGGGSWIYDVDVTGAPTVVGEEKKEDY